MSVFVEPVMAKPKGRPKTSERNDKAVKIDRRIAGWAEIVAKAQGISLAEYLSNILKVPVSKDFGRYMEQMKEGDV